MVRITIVCALFVLFATSVSRTTAASFAYYDLIQRDERPNLDQVARAVFDGSQPVKGTITFEGFMDGQTLVTVDITEGLNDPTAEYAYHIHEYPVPNNGDCMLTGSHLSPNGYPDAAQCDPQNPFSCQEGDLSGRHGSLEGSRDGSAYAEYTDEFLVWNDRESAIWGRSIVIHYPNGTRMACANIVDDSPGDDITGDRNDDNDDDDDGDQEGDNDFVECDDVE